MASAQRKPDYEEEDLGSGSGVANDDGKAATESGSGVLDGKFRAAFLTIELMTENLRMYLLSRR